MTPTHTTPAPSRLGRRLALAGGLAIAASAALAGVAGATTAPPDDSATGPDGTFVELVEFDTTAEQATRVRTDKVDEIAALIPEGLADDGTFTIGVATDGEFPPLFLYADDEETPIGNEIDIAYLVADVLGLDLDIQQTSWENLFLSVESGQYDAGFANITVTEERKDRYDFASYRVDTLAWEAPIDSEITSITEPADIAGLTVGVGGATNQEQVLLAWDAENQENGLEAADIQVYSGAEYVLALESGQLDLYFGPAPSAGYRQATRGTTHIVGTVPGGGEIDAQIAAMTARGSGWAEPIAAALNHVIESGEYAQVLDKWGVSVEAVAESLVNPPGLPRQDAAGARRRAS